MAFETLYKNLKDKYDALEKLDIEHRKLITSLYKYIDEIKTNYEYQLFTLKTIINNDQITDKKEILKDVFNDSYYIIQT